MSSERPSYVEAMGELASILFDPKTPVESINRVLRVIERGEDLVLLVLESSGATGAGEFRLKFQASDLLLETIAANRTADSQVPVILKHHGPPKSEVDLE